MTQQMAERLLVAAGGGAGLRLKRGEQLRIIDVEGGQTGDLVAFSADGRHRLSSGRTFDYGGKIYVSTGDVLWSARADGSLDRAFLVPRIHLQRRRANQAPGI